MFYRKDKEDKLHLYQKCIFKFNILHKTLSTYNIKINTLLETPCLWKHICNWIFQMSTCQIDCRKYEYTASYDRVVTCGILQDIILCPVLFRVYINDLFSIYNTKQLYQAVV